jgi:hypothetical protein
MQLDPEVVRLTYHPDTYNEHVIVSGIALLPYPKCFTHPPPQSEFSVYAAGLALDEPDSQSSALMLRVRINFTPDSASLGRFFVTYQVNYIPSMNRIDFELDPNPNSAADHLLQGGTVDVGVCR